MRASWVSLVPRVQQVTKDLRDLMVTLASRVKKERLACKVLRARLDQRAITGTLV